MKMVNVRFNENTILPEGRSYGYKEEHVISEDDAKRLGDSVTILGAAHDMFSDAAPAPVEDTKSDEPQAEEAPVESTDDQPVEAPAEEPAEEEAPVEEVSEPTEPAVDAPASEEAPVEESKDAPAYEDKQVKKTKTK